MFEGGKGRTGEGANDTGPPAPPPFSLSPFLPFGLALLALLSACASLPLEPFDRIAFTSPLAVPEEGAAIPRRAPERVLRALSLEAAASSRFPVVVSEGRVSPGTLVAHSRIRLFDDPEPDASGAARLDCLLTDAEGRPVAGAPLFAWTPPGPRETSEGPVEAALAREFGRLLARLGGRLPPEGRTEEEPPGPPAPVTAPRPRGEWPPRSHPGRTSFSARLSLLSPGPAAAGRGRGAPRYRDLWGPGLEEIAEVGYSLCPGLRAAAGFGWREFAGRTFSASGLVLSFDPFAMSILSASLRASVPLDRGMPPRWTSGWEPFEDTRGLAGVLHVQAGGAFTGEAEATVIRDDSGESPPLQPGARMPYFGRGALFFGEFLAGFQASLGEGGGFVLSASLLAGFHAASPPPARGIGSESRPMYGLALAMEVAVGF
jgi:hypothetical protein